MARVRRKEVIEEAIRELERQIREVPVGTCRGCLTEDAESGYDICNDCTATK